MTNDPTTTPAGEADLSQAKSVRRNRANAPYPEMMGDETEEQNLNQVGDPSARIGEGEVRQAFSTASAEARTFADRADKAAGETLSALTDKVNAVKDQVQQSTQTLRDQVQRSGQAARDWAAKQADSAKQLQSDKPVLVLSVSAGAALAVGLLAGFVIGRATADDY